ncbi:hypothetical protein PIB30_044001 [Stylosanthes scabra]|uniref:Uncharacterized protein n=1 Tax=Stylosanthes scabra TaxID=79078 RepID=A0ABU6VIK2_9FABA|nr:hypothetical protein [Stylosanthes scabra]
MHSILFAAQIRICVTDATNPTLNAHAFHPRPLPHSHKAFLERVSFYLLSKYLPSGFATEDSFFVKNKMEEQNTSFSVFSDMLNISNGEEHINVDSLFTGRSMEHQTNFAEHSNSQSHIGSSICTSCATEFRGLLHRILVMLGENFVPLAGKVNNCESMVSTSHSMILEIRDRLNKNILGSENILMVPTPANKITLSNNGHDNGDSVEEIIVSHPPETVRLSPPTATTILPGQHNDAERFKKTRDVDESVACTVLTGVSSGKPPRHPNIRIERSQFVTGLRPVQKGTAPVKSKDDYLVYRSEVPGQAVQDPNQAQLIPLDFLMVLRPTAAMGFKREHCKFATFVFQDNLDQKANNMCEVIFKAGQFELSREQFHSLIPGRVIDAEVLLPVIDDDGTWFLMYFDIKRRRVYSLNALVPLTQR